MMVQAKRLVMRCCCMPAQPSGPQHPVTLARHSAQPALSKAQAEHPCLNRTQRHPNTMLLAAAVQQPACDQAVPQQHRRQQQPDHQQRWQRRDARAAAEEQQEQGSRQPISTKAQRAFNAAVVTRLRSCFARMRTPVQRLSHLAAAPSAGASQPSSASASLSPTSPRGMAGSTSSTTATCQPAPPGAEPDTAAAAAAAGV